MCPFFCPFADYGRFSSSRGAGRPRDSIHPRPRATGALPTSRARQCRGAGRSKGDRGSVPQHLRRSLQSRDRYTAASLERPRGPDPSSPPIPAVPSTHSPQNKEASSNKEGGHDVPSHSRFNVQTQLTPIPKCVRIYVCAYMHVVSATYYCEYRFDPCLQKSDRES